MISILFVVIAVAIVALIAHPKKPLSTVIIEQYRPPIEKYIIGEYNGNMKYNNSLLFFVTRCPSLLYRYQIH